jgi:hypothetical protein
VNAHAGILAESETAPLLGFGTSITLGEPVLRTLHRLAAAVAGVSLVVALGGCQLPGNDDRGSATDGPGSDGLFRPTEDDYEAIRALLAARAEAVRTDDRSGFVATLDPSETAFVERQIQVFDNLRRLRVTDIHYGVESLADLLPWEPGRDPSFRPNLVEHVRIPGSDVAPVANKISFTFVRREGAWLTASEKKLTGLGERELVQSRPWGEARIHVVRRGQLTVITDAADADRADELTDLVLRVFREVTAAVDRPGSLQLVVDATTSGTVSEINPGGGDSDAAAWAFQVVRTPLTNLERSRGTAGWRIKLNPEMVLDLLKDDQVLRHEMTHHVLEGGQAAPLWISEGIAEYVGWFPTSIEDLTVPEAYFDDLVAAASRRSLPTSSEFRATSGVSYMIAFATVTHLAQTCGFPRVVDMFEFLQLRGENTTDGALRRFCATTERETAEGGFQQLAFLRH